jgi:hypothetical protein
MDFLEVGRKAELARFIRATHDWESEVERERTTKQKIKATLACERLKRLEGEREERSMREALERDRRKALAQYVRAQRDWQTSERKRIELERIAARQRQMRLEQEERGRQERERRRVREEEERAARKRRELAEIQERLKAEQARRERERQAEEKARIKQEMCQKAALEAVGAHVAVRRANSFGFLQSDGNMSDLTPAILKQMRIVKDNFSKNLPTLTISKIEYIMNDALYQQFNNTKAEFRQFGRNTKELLLFHGTKAQNVDRYLHSKCY